MRHFLCTLGRHAPYSMIGVGGCRGGDQEDEEPRAEPEAGDAARRARSRGDCSRSPLSRGAAAELWLERAHTMKLPTPCRRMGRQA